VREIALQSICKGKTHIVPSSRRAVYISRTISIDRPNEITFGRAGSGIGNGARVGAGAEAEGILEWVSTFIVLSESLISSFPVIW